MFAPATGITNQPSLTSVCDSAASMTLDDDDDDDECWRWWVQIFLNPIRVLEIFRRINVDDLELLDIAGSPENLIMTHVVVPPVCIRPSVDMEVSAGTNEDDITMKLLQVLFFFLYYYYFLGDE